MSQRSNLGFALRPGTPYPAAPFQPPHMYAEFGRSGIIDDSLDPDNRVYPMVREALFRHLGGYAGDSHEVSLEGLRRIGRVRNIVVKPNWVYQNQCGSCITTHAAVLRPIIDYLLLAFGNNVEIVVADIPLQSANIDLVWSETGVLSLREHYARKCLPVRFEDFRRERVSVDESGFILSRVPLAGDPRGYAMVSLGKESFLEEVSGNSAAFSVNDYEPYAAACRHRPGEHSYMIPKTVLAADLFVNVPKLKTHCKAGITLCMKNLIGINGDKGWIPHFRTGAPSEGGDEYPDSARLLLGLKNRGRRMLQERHRMLYRAAYGVWRQFKQGIEKASGTTLTAGGAWPGNDTLWRSILDLVTVITFADHDGRMRDSRQRTHLCVVDGIIAGEGEGPLTPSARELGCIIASADPVSADWAACRLIGYDWKRIPQTFNARRLGERWDEFPLDPDSIGWNWANAAISTGDTTDLPVLLLKPPKGWARRLELASPGAASVR